MTPSDRLRQARKEAGFRWASRFAVAADIPDSTYRSYENGHRQLPLDVARRIAPRLGVSWQYLMTGEETPADTPPESHARPAVNADNHPKVEGNAIPAPHLDTILPEGSPTRAVPIMGTAAGSLAGAFDMDSTGDPIGWTEPLPPFAGDRGLYAMYVRGDSMAPRYREGELVYVSPHRAPRQGDDVVVHTKTHQPPGG